MLNLSRCRQCRTTERCSCTPCLRRRSLPKRRRTSSARHAPCNGSAAGVRILRLSAHAQPSMSADAHNSFQMLVLAFAQLITCEFPPFRLSLTQCGMHLFCTISPAWRTQRLMAYQLPATSDLLTAGINEYLPAPKVVEGVNLLSGKNEEGQHTTQVCPPSVKLHSRGMLKLRCNARLALLGKCRPSATVPGIEVVVV